jgi:hypothetical protein
MLCLPRNGKHQIDGLEEIPTPRSLRRYTGAGVRTPQLQSELKFDVAEAGMHSRNTLRYLRATTPWISHFPDAFNINHTALTAMAIQPF